MIRRSVALWAALLALTLSAAACSSAPAPVERVLEEVTKATPAPTPTPEPAPTPLPPAAPFVVQVTNIQLAPTSNAAMFGAPESPVDNDVALAAVTAAADRLATFLDAMFVTPERRLSDAAIATLFDPASLTTEARAGLGALNRDDVRGTVTGSAAATAQVHIDGDRVGAVTLFYSASLELALADQRGPVEQAGTISFIDRGTGPEAVAVDGSTTFGGALTEVLA